VRSFGIFPGDRRTQTGLAQRGVTYFLDISKDLPEGGKFQIGKISRENGEMALAVLKKAATLAERGIVDAIVTGPVNKTAVRLADKKFIGHTEFFARQSRTKNFAMMFVSPKLKVTLATIHVPLKKISALLTSKGILEKIVMTQEVLRDGFGMKKPRIAVCA